MSSNPLHDRPGLSRLRAVAGHDLALLVATGGVCLVGALLVALMLFAMPMKYVWHDDRWVTWFGLPHGWLYMVLLITAWDLGRRVNWSLRNLVGIGLAGTVPFLSFVAEYLARKDVQRKLASSNPRVVR